MDERAVEKPLPRVELVAYRLRLEATDTLAERARILRELSERMSQHRAH
ncbi:MAG: hypothetical protein M0R74_00865 [Dehalococcoidia bacterium]|nr:hypothetical protein [Dehalococcoidia bacterium]